MIEFAPISLPTFLAEYWQKKPILFRNALPDFQTPLSPEELAGLSLEEEVESRIVLQHGAQDYQLRRGPFTEADYAALPEKNWTLLVQGCDRLVPEVADLLNDFDFLPRWRIDDIMISYATEGGNVGPHFDHYDVFLMQASGQRRWLLTHQDCHEDNYIQGVDLRLMEKFVVEDEMVLNPGDILYLPPKVGHHGIALDDQCMTFSIGYRSYRGQELWDSFGDHLSENAEFKTLYLDPELNAGLAPGEVTLAAAQQAKALFEQKLQQEATLHAWFARFATQLDQTASQMLPEPLTEEETPSLDAFIDALYAEVGLIRDSVCRFAFARIDHQVTLFINGSQWADFGVPAGFIELLANQSFLTQEMLEPWLDQPSVQALLFDLWQLQFLTFIE
ncbi:MAG: cupin domain-containing protein [Thiotrichales bacterium]|nr:cupin domain-containing protein [Thiotrichales bacterium]